MIVIVDYGMGNLRSVQKALERVGHAAEISADPSTVEAAEKLILPGVGAFRDAVSELKGRGLWSPVRRFVDSGRPFLGICLGMQLLFEESLEGGRHEGLGVFAGQVVPFDVPREFKVPHMGWNELILRRPAPILRGLADGTRVYFVHSYYPVPADRTLVAAETHYHAPFASVLWKDRIYATQFHPEKSQSDGLRILRNFVEEG
jgi:glutamine amidotransferase